LKSFDEIKQIASETLKTESDSVLNLVKYINDEFAGIVQYIYKSNGRVVITGIGKSAIVAQKIVATLNSTGTPAIFMHAADAIHGDLGIIQKEDVVIVISKSGNSPEIKVLIPLIKAAGNKVVALIGNISSFLATEADYIINTTVEKEACPNNLAPTSSSAAQMAMGDALAVCLLSCRQFTSNDFAKFHPGGNLGKKLYLKIADLAKHNPKPEVSPNDGIKNVIVEISSKRLGATAVTDNGKLLGIITDGDLRRMIEKSDSITGILAKDIMSANPKTIDSNELAVTAVSIFKEKNITQLIVTENKNYVGMIHFHDLLKEGLI
jgi:arabinose-5-phosphate isomerase